MKIPLFAFLLLIINTALTNTSTRYEEQWHTMQKKYLTLCNRLQENGATHNESSLFHHFWKTTKQEFNTLIMGKPEHRWWAKSPMINVALRSHEFGFVQAYETTFLKYCLSESIHNKIKNFKDTTVIPLKITSKEFNCSTSTLGHLYYAANILQHAEEHDISIQTIVELGGGYGNLARIFKELCPDATIIIIDLPELIAFQYLFLQENFPNKLVQIHYDVPTEFEPGSINLMPVHYLEQSSISADIFVSTFALSETPEYVQRMIINKNFFDAKLSYVVGQLQGWNNLNLNFVNHSVLISGIRSTYQHSYCQPYHQPEDYLPSYEIVGITQR